MYIRRTISKQGKKTYTNYILVESIATPKGPRQKTICSLGNLKPRSREKWVELARKVERELSGQQSLFPEEPDRETEAIVQKARGHRSQDSKQNGPPSSESSVVEIYPDKVEVEHAREAGPVYVGVEIYKRLGIDQILASCGFSENARRLTLAMVMNRLVSPRSEHAMPDWIMNTALSDLLGCDLSTINDDRLYLNLDRLYPERIRIETELGERERNLFSLNDTVFFYDLTSTYFEGLMRGNPNAQRGYSRDGRPDCKQVVIGMVINGEGFPRAHEVFAGNRHDSTTVDEMLFALETRSGVKEGTTVVVDRGMSSDENLNQIAAHKYHYLVACRQSERALWLSEFEESEGWNEIYREPSPTNPHQTKGRVLVKKVSNGEGPTYVLCLSDGRKEKDRAIREKQEKKFLNDLEKLAKGVGKGRYKKESAVHQAIGRRKERYPRVARYYTINYDADRCILSWSEKEAAKKVAEELDGGYLLKTDRKDLSGEEMWRTYIMLTRAESAFRDMKSPLSERPIFHHLSHRADTHIFLCVLAYHLLVAIEHTLRSRGDYRAWETIRDLLKTHQVVTVVLQATSGEELRIRRATKAEAHHKEVYEKLGIKDELMKPVKSWHPAGGGSS